MEGDSGSPELTDDEPELVIVLVAVELAVLDLVVVTDELADDDTVELAVLEAVLVAVVCLHSTKLPSI